MTQADWQSPISLYWTLSLTPQKCISQSDILLVAGIINTITDFLAVFLPIPTVWSLQLPSREQAIVTALFGAGFIVCAAGCIRTYYTYLVTVTTDPTWIAVPVWLSCDIELYLGIVSSTLMFPNYL